MQLQPPPTEAASVTTADAAAAATAATADSFILQIDDFALKPIVVKSSNITNASNTPSINLNMYEMYLLTMAMKYNLQRNL